MKPQIDTVKLGSQEATAYFKRLCDIESGLGRLGYTSPGGDNFAEDKINRVLSALDNAKIDVGIEKNRRDNAEAQIVKLKAEIEALKKPKEVKVGDIARVTGYGCGMDNNSGMAVWLLDRAGTVESLSSVWVKVRINETLYAISRECITKIERPAQPKPGDMKDGMVFRAGQGWVSKQRGCIANGKCTDGKCRRKNHDRLSKEITRLGSAIPRTPEDTYVLKSMIATARGLDRNVALQVIPVRNPETPDRRKK